MSEQPPHASTASAIGLCPTIIQVVGPPGTESLPRTIAPPDRESLSSFTSTNEGHFQLRTESTQVSTV